MRSRLRAVASAFQSGGRAKRSAASVDGSVSATFSSAGTDAGAVAGGADGIEESNGPAAVSGAFALPATGGQLAAPGFTTAARPQMGSGEVGSGVGLVAAAAPPALVSIPSSLKLKSLVKASQRQQLQQQLTLLRQQQRAEDEVAALAPSSTSGASDAASASSSDGGVVVGSGSATTGEAFSTKASIREGEARTAASAISEPPFISGRGNAEASGRSWSVSWSDALLFKVHHLELARSVSRPAI